MKKELIWKPGNHEGFQMKQERIRKAGKQEGISSLKLQSFFFSWIPAAAGKLWIPNSFASPLNNQLGTIN